MMSLPAWVEGWLFTHGLNVKGFKELLVRIADKIDLPEEWKSAASVWIDNNTTLSPEVILAFVALVYAELKSGAPGYSPEHGGLA